MRDFNGKVAVVTGAASGIGRALAERFAVEGMKVVMSDVERGALQSAVAEMEASGADVIAVPADVSRAEEVEALARTAHEAFGAIHVVCNNAGVAGRLAPLWEQTQADWEWVLGVNLWGVIHGIRVFVPILLAQDTEAHIVNTASIAGLITLPNSGVYSATKHAVVTISEALHLELALRGSKIKVSVLCPGFVSTRIGDSERNRPRDLAAPPAGAGAGDAWAAGFREAVATGLPPEIVAHKLVDAILEERLYVLTHPELKGAVKRRLTDVLDDRNPTFEPPFAT